MASPSAQARVPARRFCLRALLVLALGLPLGGGGAQTPPSEQGVTILASEPARRFRVSGDGCSPGEYTTPKTLVWPPEAVCEVEFPSPQPLAEGTRLVFKAWADGVKTNRRSIRASAMPQTLTAVFTRQHYLTLIANPAEGGVLQGAGWRDEDSPAEVAALAHDGYEFIDWMGVGARPPSSTGHLSLVRPVTLTALFQRIPPGKTYPVTISASEPNQVFFVTGEACSPGAYSTPQQLQWAGGATCTVQFLSPQPGSQLVFTAWQDGNTDNPRQIVMPRRPATFTALLERP